MIIAYVSLATEIFPNILRRISSASVATTATVSFLVPEIDFYVFVFMTAIVLLKPSFLNPGCNMPITNFCGFINALNKLLNLFSILFLYGTVKIVIYA